MRLNSDVIKILKCEGLRTYYGPENFYIFLEDIEVLKSNRLLEKMDMHKPFGGFMYKATLNQAGVSAINFIEQLEAELNNLK